jgi:hypothetical protein
MALSKKKFIQGSKPIQVTVNGRPYTASARVFESGSVGFNINDKVDVVLEDGTVVKCQLGLNLTAIKSKEWPE